MQSITIGRSHECDYVISNDAKVSRCHCRIDSVGPNQYRITDLNSLNGTYVNGYMIGGSQLISPRDEVKVGYTVVDWVRLFDSPGYASRGGGMGPRPRGPHPSHEQLDDDLNFWMVLLLSIVTLGIYGIIVWTRITNNVNTIATPHDKRHTMHYCLMIFLFSWITLGIYPLIWNHNLASRVGNELRRRRIDYNFGVGTWWGWGVAGNLLFGIGSQIYLYKLIQAMNRLCHDYNERG